MRKRLLTAALAACILLVAATGCEGELAENKVYSASDMEGKSVGVVRGTAAESLLRSFSTIINVVPYDDISGLARGLRDGSVDCAVCAQESVEDMRDVSSKLYALDERFVNRLYRFGVSADNTAMLQRIDKALKSLTTSGVLASILAGKGYEAVNAGEYTASVAVDPTFEPYCYYDENGDLAGIEIDLTRAVCDEIGIAVEFTAVEPDKLIYMAESGKVTFAVGRITSDMSEGLVYSEPYMNDVECIVVRKNR